MDEMSLRETITAMAHSPEHRSQTARLNAVFDEIEHALRAGVARAALHDALHREGFTLTFHSFESALARLRKRRRTVNAGTAKSPTHDDGGMKMASVGGESMEDKPMADQITARRAVSLPDDWLTGVITPAQARMLTPEQKLARRKAREEKYFPNPYKKPA